MKCTWKEKLLGLKNSKSTMAKPSKNSYPQADQLAKADGSGGCLVMRMKTANQPRGDFQNPWCPVMGST